MQWPTLLVLGALSTLSTALLRFQCSQLVVQRLDPLVAPGQIPSTHLHQIVGGVRNSSSQYQYSQTDENRMPLTSQWILRVWISQQQRHAHPALSARIFQTTGPQFSSSKPRTGLSSVFLKLHRSQVLKLELRYITCKTRFMTPSRRLKSQHSSP